MKQLFSPKQKVVIALEAIKGVKENTQLASQYGVHPIKIGLWKKTILENAGITISMDGKGRCIDNIFTERLWRTVKYEDIYLKSYYDIAEAKKGLQKYFAFYNKRRKHQSLNYHTPEETYFSKVEQ